MPPLRLTDMEGKIMAYAILMMKKIKTKAQLQQAYEHHYREEQPINADPELKDQNDIVIPVAEGNYVKAFNKRKSELEYYDDHTFRKDGVKAIDIVFEYSAEASQWLDTEKWKEDNVKWLEDTFGKENVMSVVYHYDEASYTEQGMVHGHAVVIPVDDKGAINCSYYMGKKEDLRNLQDSYAKAMEVHKLERGINHSGAYHQDVKRFYQKLTNAIYGVPMPAQEPGESDKEYIEKLKDAWRTERSAHVKELQDKDRENLEVKAQYKPDPELIRHNAYLENEVEKYKDRDDQLVREFGSMDGMISQARAMKLLNEYIEEYPDANKAGKLSGDIVDAIDWQERENQRKRQKIRTEEKG